MAEDEDHRKLSDRAIEHRHVAGVVGDAVLLLVGAFVFLIDDDEAQFFPRQEQGRAGADDDFRFAAGHAAPDALAFARPQVGMPLRRFGAEAGFDAGEEIWR